MTRFGDETAPTPCLLILCASVTILFFYNNDTTSQHMVQVGCDGAVVYIAETRAERRYNTILDRL